MRLSPEAWISTAVSLPVMTVGVLTNRWPLIAVGFGVDVAANLARDIRLARIERDIRDYE